MSTELYLIYVIGFSILAALLVLIIAGKWLFLALKIFLGRLLWKENTGLIIFANRNNKLGFPKVANFSKSTFKHKKNKHPLPTGNYDGEMFGLPYLIIPIDDVTKTAGLYYPITTKEGVPEYYKNDNGDFILDDDNNKIPKLSRIKQGASLTPEFLKTIILDQALTSAIKDLFAKHKNLFIVAIVAAGASVVAAYFMYDFNANYLPEMMKLLRQAAQCTAQVPLEVTG